MPAYVIVQINVTDWEKFQKYVKETPRVMAQYGGRYLARAGDMAALEGNPSSARVVLIEFPSLQRAREWYNSPEYQEIKRLREGVASGTILAVEGC